MVIPIKAFDRAKERLADVLDGPARAALARSMAERVLEAASPVPVVVVCDDDDVAAWARDGGAAVLWTPGLGLNGAVTAAVQRLNVAGVDRAIVAHADLPFASDLRGFADIDPRGRGAGPRPSATTGPTSCRCRPEPASALRTGRPRSHAHLAETERCGLTPLVIRAAHLAWDVDEPDDLHPPAQLGSLPLSGLIL